MEHQRRLNVLRCRAALVVTEGNVLAAARLMGMHRSTFNRIIDSDNIRLDNETDRVRPRSLMLVPATTEGGAIEDQQSGAKKMKPLRCIGIAIVFAFLALPSVARATVWTMPSLPQQGPANAAVSVQGLLNNGGSTTVGSVSIAAIGTPSAPTFTVNGTAGSTSIVYACTGVDVNGNATIPSATATIATANATLTTTNSVSVFCPGKKGALAFLVHKVDTSHVLGICYTNSGVGCTLIDDGSVATTFTYTPNTIDQTGGVQSGGGIQHLGGSTNAVVSNSVETYFPTFGSGTGDVTATIGDASVLVNGPATIKNLNCGTFTILGAAVAAGGTSWTFALTTAAVGATPTDSTLTCIEATAATVCADTTHVIQLAAGSQMEFSITPSGSPTAAVAKCSADIYE